MPRTGGEDHGSPRGLALGRSKALGGRPLVKAKLAISEPLRSRRGVGGLFLPGTLERWADLAQGLESTDPQGRSVLNICFTKHICFIVSTLKCQGRPGLGRFSR